MKKYYFVLIAIILVSGLYLYLPKDVSAGVIEMVAEMKPYEGIKFFCRSTQECPVDGNDYTCTTADNNVQNTSKYMGFLMNIKGGDKPGTLGGLGVCVSQKKNEADEDHAGCAKYACPKGNNVCVPGYSYTSKSSFCVLAAPPKPVAPPTPQDFRKKTIMLTQGNKCIPKEGEPLRVGYISVNHVPPNFDQDRLLLWADDASLGDKFMPAEGAPIPEGTTIKIPSAGGDGNEYISIEVKLGNSVIHLSENSVMTLPCLSGVAEFNEGLMDALIRLKDGEQFEVTTKNAIGGVKGTHFIVDARDSAATKWYLKEGSLEIAPRNAPEQKFTLTAGNSVSVTATKAEAPRPMSDVEAALFGRSSSAPIIAQVQAPVQKNSNRNYFWLAVVGVIALVGGYLLARKSL